MTAQVVDAFFDIYEAIINKHKLQDKPQSMFNLDETGLNTDRRSVALYVGSGKRDTYIKTPTAGKTSISVLFCISALGQYLPPFTIYKAKHLYDTWTIEAYRYTTR